MSGRERHAPQEDRAMGDDVTAIMQAQAQYDATLERLFAGSTDDEVRAELDAAIDMRHWYEADLASDELERRARQVKQGGDA